MVMIFDFFCNKCDLGKEVIARIGQCPKDINCDQCGENMQRIYYPPQFIGTSVENAEYNPAFGKVIKNKYERKEMAKRMNLEEVGTTSQDSLHKIYDDHKKKLDKPYED